jgi:hypothetical protein
MFFVQIAEIPMSFSFAAFESLAETYFASNQPEEEAPLRHSYTPPSPCAVLIHLYQQHFSYIDNTTIWSEDWSQPQDIPTPPPRIPVTSTKKDKFVDSEYTGSNKKRKAKAQAVKIEPPFIPKKERGSSEYIASLVQNSPGLSEFLVMGEAVEAGSEDEDGEIECSGIERLVLLVARGDVELPEDVKESLRVDQEYKRKVVQDVVGWDREKSVAGWNYVNGSWQ